LFFVYRVPGDNPSSSGASLDPSLIYRTIPVDQKIPVDQQKGSITLPVNGMAPGRWWMTEVTITNMESLPVSL
jgi:hypothetical protein